MEKMTHSVKGRVISPQSNRGVAGIRVEVFDKDEKYDDLLGVAITDRQGNFRIKFNRSYFREYSPETAPDLYFNVQRGEQTIKTTKDSVIVNAGEDVTVDIMLDEPVQPPPGKDRIKASQVYNGLVFYQQSDFRGVFNEGKDRSKTMGSLIGDIVMCKLKDIKIDPIRPPAFRNNSIAGQSIEVAQNNLRMQSIEVEQVREYDACTMEDPVNTVTSFPLNLKEGDKVTLYQQEGIVKYYSVNRKQDRGGSGDGDQQSDINSLRSELKAVQEQSLAKDRQIETLQAEVNSIKAGNEQILSRMTPENLQKLDRLLQQADDPNTDPNA